MLDTTGAIDGQVITYSSATGSLGLANASGSSITSYNTIGDLPSSGNTVGDRAFVISTNSMYIWGASNTWFSIGVAGSPPSAISNVFSQYTLSTSGANTVLVPTSSSPDGLPLTWNYEVVSGTLGNSVVSVQGNIYNIQPSTDSVDTGTFVLKLSANDGIYSSNASVTFDLPLVSGWNVSSASASLYQNAYFYVGNRESAPYGITFKPDGTRMYLVGSAGDDINEFSLSTPFNLDTASFITQYAITSNAVSNNFVNPSSVEFSPEGSNVYLLGETSVNLTVDCIIQCKLLTPWDLSSLVLPPNFAPFNTSTEESTPHSITFNPEGTRMYIVGTVGDDINQYNLSEAWNPGSASFIGSKVLTGELTPEAQAWSSDGSNVYVVGPTADNVRQYSLSVPWTVANLNSTAIAGISVTGQETNPTGLTFKPDGTRMYLIGETGDDVNEYALSTPWSLATATFVGASASLAAQASSPQDLRFNPEGTILYTIGTGYTVYAYNLATAWDISTISFNYAWTPNYGAGSLSGMHFSEDGHYFYLLAYNNSNVIPFYLRTAWDLRSATYKDRLVDAANFNGAIGAVGFNFNSNGSKIYVQDEAKAQVTEYSLSESYNISSVASIAIFSTSLYSSSGRSVFLDSTDSNLYIGGSTSLSVLKMAEASNLQTAYASQIFNAGSNLSLITSMYVSPSGDKMFCSIRGGIVYQLNMSTPFDVDTISWSGNTLNVTSQESGFLTAMTLNHTGDKLWILGGGTGKLFQYTLSTPWDLSTASYTKFNILKWPTAVSGLVYEYSIRFYDNGYKFYMIINEAILAQYSLEIAYDLGSVIDSTFLNISYAQGVSVFTSIDFVHNGYTLLLGAENGRMFSSSLKNPYDISSLALTGRNSFIPFPTSTVLSGFTRYITSDGLYIFSGIRENTSITRHTMIEPGNIYSATHPAVLEMGSSSTFQDIYITDNTVYTMDSTGDNVWVFPTSQSSNNFMYLKSLRVQPPMLSSFYATIDSFEFKPDGTKLFVLDTGNDQLIEYSLSSPWNIESGLYITNSFSILNVGVEATPNGITISRDGKHFYIVGSTGDVVVQFSTVVPWSIQNLSLTAVLSVSAQETFSTAIQFDYDGTNMYVMGTTGDDINQYSLSTPWDISTASFVRVSASLAAQDGTPQSFAFKPDGSRMYVRGSTNRRVSEYTLGTPWDVSTLSYSRQFQVSTQFTGLGGIAFKPDGKKMYLGDTTSGYLRLVEYDLGS